MRQMDCPISASDFNLIKSPVLKVLPRASYGRASEWYNFTACGGVAFGSELTYSIISLCENIYEDLYT
jgi:hypothetical protein